MRSPLPPHVRQLRTRTWIVPRPRHLRHRARTREACPPEQRSHGTLQSSDVASIVHDKGIARRSTHFGTADARIPHPPCGGSIPIEGCGDGLRRNPDGRAAIPDDRQRRDAAPFSSCRRQRSPSGFAPPLDECRSCRPEPGIPRPFFTVDSPSVDASGVPGPRSCVVVPRRSHVSEVRRSWRMRKDGAPSVRSHAGVEGRVAGVHPRPWRMRLPVRPKGRFGHRFLTGSAGVSRC